MAQQFLQGHQNLFAQTVFLIPQGNTVSLIEIQCSSAVLGGEAPVMMTDRDRQHLREESRQRDAAKLAGFLAKQPVLGKSEPAYLNDQASRTLVRRDEMGIRSPNGVAGFDGIFR